MPSPQGPVLHFSFIQPEEKIEIEDKFVFVRQTLYVHVHTIFFLQRRARDHLSFLYGASLIPELLRGKFKGRGIYAKRNLVIHSQFRFERSWVIMQAMVDEQQRKAYAKQALRDMAKQLVSRRKNGLQVAYR